MLEALRNDPPGQRFERQFERIRHRSPWVRVLMSIAGVLLVVAGIAFMVLPGPGLPLLVLGLGLLAGMSRTLARGLDRAEPFVRRQLHRLVRRWRALGAYGKVGVVAGAALVCGGAGFAAVRIAWG